VQVVVASANLLTDRSDSTHEGELGSLEFARGLWSQTDYSSHCGASGVYLSRGQASIKTFRSEVDAAGVFAQSIRPESKLAVSDHVAVCFVEVIV